MVTIIDKILNYFKNKELKKLEHIISNLPNSNTIDYLLNELPRTVDGDWLNIQICGEKTYAWYGHHIGKKIVKGSSLEECLTNLLNWCKLNNKLSNF